MRAFLAKPGAPLPVTVFAPLLALAFDRGAVDDALSVFVSLAVGRSDAAPTVALCNQVIAGCGRAMRPRDALSVFRAMRSPELGLRPDATTYTLLLRALSGQASAEAAAAVAEAGAATAAGGGGGEPAKLADTLSALLRRLRRGGASRYLTFRVFQDMLHVLSCADSGGGGATEAEAAAEADTDSERAVAAEDDGRGEGGAAVPVKAYNALVAACFIPRPRRRTRAGRHGAAPVPADAEAEAEAEAEGGEDSDASDASDGHLAAQAYLRGDLYAGAAAEDEAASLQWFKFVAPLPGPQAALAVIDRMRRRGGDAPLPTAYTYQLAVDGCIACGDLETALLLLDRFRSHSTAESLRRSGAAVYSRLVRALCEAGEWAQAARLHDAMCDDVRVPEGNGIRTSDMLCLLARAGRLSQALEVYEAHMARVLDDVHRLRRAPSRKLRNAKAKARVRAKGKPAADEAGAAEAEAGGARAPLGAEGAPSLAAFNTLISALVEAAGRQAPAEGATPPTSAAAAAGDLAPAVAAGTGDAPASGGGPEDPARPAREGGAGAGAAAAAGVSASGAAAASGAATGTDKERAAWVLGRVLGIAGDMGRVGCAGDAETYALLIDAYLRAGQVDRALGVRDLMPLAGVRGGASTRVHNMLVHALVREGRLADATGEVTRMLRGGPRPDVYTLNALAKAYADAGDPGTLEVLLDDFAAASGVSPDVVTHTIVMSGWHRAGRPSRVLAAFAAMVQQGVAADATATRVLLRSLLRPAPRPRERRRSLTAASGGGDGGGGGGGAAGGRQAEGGAGDAWLDLAKGGPTALHRAALAVRCARALTSWGGAVVSHEAAAAAERQWAALAGPGGSKARAAAVKADARVRGLVGALVPALAAYEPTAFLEPDAAAAAAEAAAVDG